MNETKIEIFKAGKYGDDTNRQFSKKEVQQIIDNYDISFRQAPVVLGHNSLFDGEKPAYGWVESLELENDILKANITFNDELKDLVKSKKYQNVSIEVTKDISRFDSNSDKQGAYLLAVALLGGSQPAVSGLKKVSFEAQLKEHSQSFTYTPTIKGTNMDIEELKSQLTDLKAENQALKSKIAEFAKQQEEQQEKEQKSKIELFLSENSKKFLPKDKEQIQSFMLSLDEKNLTTFKNYISNLNDLELFKELSDQANKEPRANSDDLVSKQAKSDFAIYYQN